MEFSLGHSKPFLAVIFMQIGYASISVIAKFALNQGLSPSVLVAYRMVVATALIAPFAFVLERRSRPKMTFTVLAKIFLLSLLDPVLEHNMYYVGMKHTTATFASALVNIVPAITFILACIFRLEKVDIRSLHGQAKVVGTLLAIGGAMIMTFVKGLALELPWTKRRNHQNQSTSDAGSEQDLIKGAAMIISSCISYACFIIMQAKILKSYPAELSLTALICMMGMVECALVAYVMERGNTATWSIELDSKFLAALYVSGLAYYLMGWVMKQKGPLFVSAFSPLTMVLIAITGSIFLSEDMYLGRVIAGIVIVVGIYLVLWGKSKDQAPSTNEPNPEVITVDATAVNPIEEYQQNC